ncbi:MAG TPA: TonB-dependent receptor [Candidatus Acidoferrum sp.]|nr:TonB-dependent receptor [Candidatus Acidoferrum sp.]
MNSAKNSVWSAAKKCSGALISRVAIALLLFAVAALSANAQVQNGIFTGTVTDPQGASVPSADVAITNVGTGNTVTVKTGSEGLYRVPELPVGNYRITVTAPGFKREVKANLYLGAGVIERVDFKLELGQATETVEVEAGAVQVQTEDARLYDTFSQTQIANLPLNGRNVFDLISLVPGAVDATGVSFENGHNTVVNGLRPNFSGFLINGVSDKGLSGGNVTTPNADIVQEFQELTLNMSAQYGNSAAAIVNVVTKSGTNSLHGSVYEFLRNDKFDANDFFRNASPDRAVNSRPSELRFNQFGGTVTGPIWKDHLFFTASYQGDRFITAQPAAPVVSESAAWRQAVTTLLPNSVAAAIYKDPRFQPKSDGSPVLNSSLQPWTVTDTVTSSYGSFLTLVCPSVFASTFAPGFDSAVAQFQQLFGVTAAEATACGGGLVSTGATAARTTQFLRNNTLLFGAQTQGNLFDGNEWSTRIDWVKGQNDRIFGEYYWQHEFDSFGSENISSGIHGFKNPTASHFPNFQASWVHTFSPTLINEAKAGYVLNRTDTQVAIPGVPQISFDDGTAGFGSYSGYPQFFHENIYSYGDMMSLQKGKHSLKFGADFRRNIENSEFDIARPSYYAFDQLFFAAGAPYSENAGTDPGFVSSKPAELSDNFRHWRNLEVGAYFQDDWKVTKKLTLNFGLRWDLFTRHTEKSGKVTTFLPGPGCEFQSNGFCADAILNANAPIGSPGCSSPFQMSHAVLAGVCGPGGFAIAKNLGAGNHKNFGPRAAFAYDPWGNGKTAIRGGFGISYEGTLYNPLSNSRWNPPFYSFNLETNALGGGVPGAGGGAVVFGPTTTCDLTTTACTPSGAAVTFTGPGTNIGMGTGAQATGNISGYFSGDPNTAFLTGIVFPEGIRDPYVLNSYFGVQREILPKTVLEVNYVGTLGDHLFRAEQGNRLPGERLPAGATVVDNFGRTLTGLGHRYLNTNYGVLRIWDNVSKSWYNSLQVAVRHQATRGLVFNGNYTWSHSIDTGSDWHSGATSANGGAAGDGYSLDPTKPGLDRGNSTFDIRHRFSINYVYEFPWMKAQKGFAGHVFGGWQYQGLWAYQTGAHWTPFCAAGNRCDFNFDGTRNDRPDVLVSNHHNATHGDWANGWFQPGGSLASSGMQAWCGVARTLANPAPPCSATTSFFQTPCLGCDGNLGRNTFVGPSLSNTDESLFKNIKISERFNFQFRFEVFNALNHTNFKLPNGATGGNNGNHINGAANFGQSFGEIAPRHIQFGLKLLF